MGNEFMKDERNWWSVWSNETLFKNEKERQHLLLELDILGILQLRFVQKTRLGIQE